MNKFMKEHNVMDCWVAFMLNDKNELLLDRAFTDQKEAEDYVGRRGYLKLEYCQVIIKK